MQFLLVFHTDGARGRQLWTYDQILNNLFVTVIIIRRNPAEGKAVHQVMVKLLHYALVGLIIGINYDGAWF